MPQSRSLAAGGGYHLGGYGRSADRPPVSGETSTSSRHSASCSTVLAVMQLVRAGRIRLDAPVRTYLTVVRH